MAGRMNESKQPRHLTMLNGDGYGRTRVVVAVRVAVVVSIVALVLIGPVWMRVHLVALVAMLILAFAYSAVMLARPHLEIRRTRYAWLVSALDTALTLALVALTGGPDSPVIAVFALVIVGAAARLTLTRCVVVALVLSVGYLVVVLTAPDENRTPLPAPMQGLWWSLYVVLVAILSGGLSILVEQSHRSRIDALVEAESERAAIQEERDLRSRLLRSYEAQQEGLQVLLHELRTPVASLRALTGTIDQSDPLHTGNHGMEIGLIGRHARHLSDMLDALSDVNLSRQPAFLSGRMRRVDVAELIGEAGDAADIRPPRLRFLTIGDVSSIQVDAQGLRRILTNLLENAGRHGRGQPIDVVCERDAEAITISVHDRGPGVAQQNLGSLTGKFVSLSDRSGTAGLGLWIVQQIVDALGGTLQFSARDGGGLTASFSVPVSAR